MTVRARLLLAMAGIILLMLIPAAYGLTELQRLRDIAIDMEYIHADDILALGQLRASLTELDRLQRSYVATPAQSFRDGMHRELGLIRSHLAVLAASGYTGAVEPVTALVDSLVRATARIEELVESDRRQEATAYFLGVRPLLDSARLSLNLVGEALDERGRASVELARRVSAAATQTTTLAAVIALLLTAGLGLWAADMLSRPLRQLSRATAAVADGDFVAPPDLPYDRLDEIGDLSRSFGAMTQRLAELDRLKAEFVSLASHELKTPINIVVGYAELLQSGLYGELDAKQLEVVALIQSQTETLTRLVNQLLDLSRFEAGGLRIEPAHADLRRILADVERSFRGLATQKQIDFRVEADDSLPATVVLDADRIQHEVLGNLLSNAFKFTPSGGRIRVRASSRAGRVHLDVDDTGAGIPADQLDHIFDKYYQVGADAKAQGSGLGLAIVRHVVDAHGGTITASSRRPREGTRFETVLPAAGPPGATVAGSADTVTPVAATPGPGPSA